MALDDLPRLDSAGSRVRAFGFQRSATHVHNGIDLPAAEGAPVYAPEGGNVVHAYNEYHPGFSGYGKVVVIRDSEGNHLLFAHLKRPMVNLGDRVEAGAHIGEVGRTGYTSQDHYALVKGAHLHFEVSPRQYPQKSELARLDPVAYLLAGRVHPLKRERFGGGSIPEATPVEQGSSSAEGPFVVPQAHGVLLRLRGRCPHCSGYFSSIVATAELEREL
jgi:murein DD-endopeptidase MepM/ murein hydrolase activator NlpD